MEETITKKSSFEVEITTVEPEQVIPEKVTKRTVTLAELKRELANFTEEFSRWTAHRGGLLNDVEKADEQIAAYSEKVASTNALIAEAEAQGVVDEKQEEEVVEPMPIEEKPVSDVSPI